MIRDITNRQPTYRFIENEKMDPRNPTVIEAREANSEYIVYYSQERGLHRWNFERVCDKAIIASGSLQSMLALLPLYLNSRRATWAEDTLRYTPYFLRQEAADDQKRIDDAFNKLLNK